MPEEHDHEGTIASTTDDLRRLRDRAGAPSFASMATQITELRTARGDAEAMRTVARSTVYDVFRSNRKRLDATLVADVVRVLGGDDEEVARWRRRCAAIPSEDSPAVSRSTAATTSSPPPVRAATVTVTVPTQAAAGFTPPGFPLTASRMAIATAAAVVLATVVNLSGGQIVLWLDLPIYLDMIGTAIVAIAFGPWTGVLAAIVTHLSGALLHESTAGLPFTIVSVVGALLFGYGVRAWGLGRTPLRFFGLSLIVAVACTLVAAPLTIFMYDGFTAHVAGNSLTERLLSAGTLWSAVFSANLITSLIDKVITGFIALTAGFAIAAWLGIAPWLGVAQRRAAHERS